MSDINNTPSLDDGNFEDASTSIEDLPIRITSIATSSVTILNSFGKNDSIHFNRHNKTPVAEDSSSGGATSSAPKSTKIMKYGSKHRQMLLGISDVGDSDSSDTSLPTSSTPKNINKCSIDKISSKPHCQTNILKTLSSFEKNNLGTSNKGAGKYILDRVKHVTKSPINPKINKLPEKNIRRAITDTKKSKKPVDAAFKTSRTLDESQTTLGGTSSAVPKINFTSFDWKSHRAICNSTNIEVPEKDFNAQDRFKLKVPMAKSKMEYLSRTCKFFHLREPEMAKPLLILDFDSLFIPFKLPSEELSMHRQEISRFIHTMYPLFNIAIWSASTMKVFISRLIDLDVLDDAKITKILFCLDISATSTAFVPGFGNTIVKSPEVIWNLYPQFHKKNTIMINQDLKKYVFKQNEIPVGVQEDQQRIKYFELVTMSNFLSNLITSNRSFSNLNIQSWKEPWN